MTICSDDTPGAYHVDRVKVPLLGWLALRSLGSGTTEWSVDDSLLDEIAGVLAELHARHSHRRRAMPFDWTAEALLDELLECEILERPKLVPTGCASPKRTTAMRSQQPASQI